jgi:hypothetical protein
MEYEQHYCCRYSQGCIYSGTAENQAEVAYGRVGEQALG